MINFSFENGACTLGNVDANAVSRAELAKNFGSWYGKEETPATLVSWFSNQIDKYQKAIIRMEAARKVCQKEMLKGLTPAEVQAIAAEMQA